MKILRITLHNLASLAGTHTVDFTRDPLRSAGLFSISGVTGAGKSTLLDALCLALYDDTPRLQRVGRLAELASGEKQNDPRNLLRRGTGDGFAEVAFVGVDGQNYTSRWSVRRSRRQSDGALQQVDLILYLGHISPGGAGPVVSGGKKTLVLRDIEQKIGLSFEQFTRAVLLAQNEFASFLKADDRQRAEILQALTGTEQFEDVSRRVYERCTIEERVLKTLQDRLDGNPPLSEDLRRDAEAKVAELDRQLDRASQELIRFREHAEWFVQRDKLHEEKVKADEARDQARLEQVNAEPRRRELMLTEEVLRDGRPLHIAVINAEQVAADAAAALIQSGEECERHRQRVLEANRDAERAAELLRTLLAEQQRTQPLLVRARQLDVQLSSLQARVQADSETLKAAQKELASITNTQQALQSRRSLALQNQQALLRQREHVREYLPFSADSTAWLDRLNAAIAAMVQLSTARDGAQTAQRQLEKTEAQLSDETSLLTALQQKRDHAAANLAAAIADEKQFDPDQLAADRDRLQAGRKMLQEFQRDLKEIQDLKFRELKATADLDELTGTQADETAELRALQTDHLPAAKIALDASRQQLEFIRSAVDDHARRLRLSLQEGRECPVCGSTDHPFSRHEPDLELTAVNAAGESLKQFSEKYEQLCRREARLQSTIESRSQRIHEARSERDAVIRKIAERVTELSDHPEYSDIAEYDDERRLIFTEQRLTAVETSLNGVVQREQHAREAARKTSECLSARDQADREFENLSVQVAGLLTRCEVERERAGRAAAEVLSAEQRFTDCDSRLTDLRAGLRDATTQLDKDPSKFREQFAQSTEECRRIEAELHALSQAIETADAELRALGESVQRADAAVRRCETVLSDTNAEYRELADARGQIFEGRSADETEAEIQQRVNSARTTSELTAEARQKAENERIRTEAEYRAGVSAEETSRRLWLEAVRVREQWLEAFSLRMQSACSGDDLNRILQRDDVWLQAERAMLRSLDDAVTHSAGACQVHSERLREHMAVCPTNEERDSILSRLNVLQQEHQQIRETRDAARAVLISDDRQREAGQRLSDQIRQQDAATDPWRRLNELIGSADGAKFRNIAQRRTLDILLGYANRQLNGLTSRYRLDRLPESLNLVVVDGDLGDEQRSVHSLSGGESFLVSLALALGLASLTSNRLRIESLFIDEGFGSLDQETLQTAMGALMQLEAQGRKVGVISHVAEMADAIPVQIQVVKGRSGASRIVVPGSAADDVSEVSLPPSEAQSEPEPEPQSVVAPAGQQRVPRKRRRS